MPTGIRGAARRDITQSCGECAGAGRLLRRRHVDLRNVEMLPQELMERLRAAAVTRGGDGMSPETLNAPIRNPSPVATGEGGIRRTGRRNGLRAALGIAHRDLGWPTVNVDGTGLPRRTA